MDIPVRAALILLEDERPFDAHAAVLDALEKKDEQRHRKQ
jgi:hypothetical protein